MLNTYWQLRELERIDLIDQSVEENIREIQKIFTSIYDNLEKEIQTLYLKYSIDNKISYEETLKYLTNNERIEFQKDLKYYIETYKDKDKAQVFKQELQALSVRARVKRIERIQAKIMMDASKIYDHLNGNTQTTLFNVYDEAYSHMAYSMAELNVGVRFDIPAFEVLSVTLEYPWSGKNYSEKIWMNTRDLQEKLNTVVKTGLIQGKSIDKITRDLRVALAGPDGEGGSLYQVKRLVRTEANYVANQATKNLYEKNDLEEYQFSATLDLRTSKICGRLDGQMFLVQEAVAGSNYPPMHPFCRSTTVPVIRWEGEEPEIGPRIARNPVTGKNEIINNMTYTEWKKRFHELYKI